MDGQQTCSSLALSASARRTNFSDVLRQWDCQTKDIMRRLNQVQPLEGAHRAAHRRLTGEAWEDDAAISASVRSLERLNRFVISKFGCVTE